MVKRLVTILLTLLVCTLLTLGTMAILVRSSHVQTAVVQMLTTQLSHGLGADVSVEKVDIRGISGLDIHGIYLSDRWGDTLCYIPCLSVSINPLRLREEHLDFTSISLEQPYVNLVQDSTATNMDFLLRAFSRPDTLSSPLPIVVSAESIVLSQARIRYRNLSSGMDVLLTPIDAEVTLPELSADTIDARLVALNLNADIHTWHMQVNGCFHGTMDSVYADDLRLHYRDTRMLTGNIQVIHPLQLDSMYARVSCQELYANPRLVEQLLSEITCRPQILPDVIRNFGDVHYRGKLEGRLRDMTFNGAFLTRVGAIHTNLHFATTPQLDQINFQGKVSTGRFRLGQLLRNEQLNRASARAQISGVWQEGKPLSAEGSLNIDQIDFHDYTYQNISINGNLRDTVFCGNVDIEDDNLTLHIDGKSDFGKQNPFSDILIRLEHLRLNRLHLTEQANDQDLRFISTISLRTDGPGTTLLDKLYGSIDFDSLHLDNFGTTLDCRELKLVMENQPEGRSLRLYSDFANLGISGTFEWSSIPATMQHFAHQLFPSTIAPPVRDTLNPNDVDFYFYLLDADTLLHVLTPIDANLPYRQTLRGFIHESQQQYILQAHIPSVWSDNTEIRNITMSLDNQANQANLVLSLMAHSIDQDSTQLTTGDLSFLLKAQARHDSLLTGFHFRDVSRETEDNVIRINTHFTRYAHQLFTSTHILPSQFFLGNDTLWTMDEARIEYNRADTTLAVHHFGLRTASQYLRANGMVSPHNTDSIRIDMQDINLEYLLGYTNVSRSLCAQGMVSGWATLYALFSSPMFEAKLTIPDAHINHTPVGQLDAVAELDRENRRVIISGDGVLNERKVVHVDGNIIPEQKYWEIMLHADSVNTGFVNFWTKDFLQDISGETYGDVHIFGSEMKTWVVGSPYVKHGAITLPSTGARYYFSDTIHLDTAAISFHNITLYDDSIRERRGEQTTSHTATLDGVVNHYIFKSFDYRLGINCHNVLVFDIPYDQQQSYYGRIYADAQVDVRGDDYNCKVDVTGSTTDYSDFYFSIATASSAMDNAFIEFVNPKAQVTRHQPPVRLRRKRAVHRASSTQVTLNIEVTPQATMHLALDPHNGDGITGRGEGDIRLIILNDNIQLLGTYTLLSGLFSYSVANLVHRDFDIAEGSKVTWNGTPQEPILDVTAKYRVTASLKDLFGADASTLATNRSSVPVNCIIYLSDRLSNPVLRFGIELPQSDESVSSQVMSLINTEEMLMRQVIYLLVFNRFYTPEYLQTQAQTGLNETYSLLSSTVTGQINQWLGRLTNIFSLGFNFRTDGEGQDASQEYEAQFKLQPVNRLSINGNFGYRYNDLSNRPFFGDVDVEYQLTRNGKLRAKAYTHTVDKYSLKQANTVQGIGLIFRHDFNWGDARRKRKK
ncbi:MAG: translocation/assembly module TamB [Paludibacteraceae bacterium]|nr:translocation/assembly module TamB [Paludibacteraceae bacterium]